MCRWCSVWFVFMARGTRTLTDKEALWAIRTVASGKMTQTEVAAKLGVTLWLVNKLINGRIYKHLHGKASQRISDRGVRFGLAEVPERRRWREAKFWARVDRSGGPASCWPWIGGKPDDYGRTPIGNELVGSTTAHVVAHTLATGLATAPDPNTVLRHLCDNKPCCNPAHLKPGTVSENLKDRWRSQREGYSGPRTVEEPVPEPPGGWRIVCGDLAELDREARIAEFWARVDSSGGPTTCWPWTAAARHSFGYGQMSFEGENAVPAHRIAYAVARGLRLADIKGQTILHKCPNHEHRNNCNNPAHLEAGTQAENINDKKIHGTMPMGERHYMGSRYPDAMIVDIRRRYWCAAEDSRPTMTALATEAGVGVTLISSWLRGLSRREAGGPTGPEAVTSTEVL